MKTKDQILKIKAVVLYILKAFPEGVDKLKKVCEICVRLRYEVKTPQNIW